MTISSFSVKHCTIEMNIVSVHRWKTDNKVWMDDSSPPTFFLFEWVLCVVFVEVVGSGLFRWQTCY